MEPYLYVYRLWPLVFVFVGVASFGACLFGRQFAEFIRSSDEPKNMRTAITVLSLAVCSLGLVSLLPGGGDHIVIGDKETVIGKFAVTNGWVRVVTTDGNTVRVRDIASHHPEDLMVKKLVIDEKIANKKD